MTSSKHYEKLRKHEIRIKTKKLVRNIIRPGSVEKLILPPLVKQYFFTNSGLTNHRSCKTYTSFTSSATAGVLRSTYP